MSSAVLSLIKHPCSVKKWNPTRHYATRLTCFESVAPVSIGSTVISRSRTLMLNRNCLTQPTYQIAPPDTAHKQHPKYQATASDGGRESRTPLRTVSPSHVVVFGTTHRPHLRSRGFAPHTFINYSVYESSIRYAASRSFPVPMLLFDWRQLQQTSGSIHGKSFYTLSTLLEDMRSHA
jgi:hypothetical protein